MIREYSARELQRNDGPIERGRFAARDHSIRMREPLKNHEFESVFLHEVAHALIHNKKKRLRPADRSRIFGSDLAPFLSGYVLPSLTGLKDQAVSHLGTTYIDELFNKRRSMKMSNAFLKFLAGISEELLCDLFALYALTGMKGLGSEFRDEFERQLARMGLPLPWRPN